MGVLQGAEDLARVYLHSAALGIPEWAQRHFGDPAVADATDRAVAQSRANTGYAGSVANVAGFFSPGGVAADAIRGVKMIPAAVRAAPSVARVVPAAERAVRAVVNPGRANAYARLGLGEVPTVTGAIGENVAAAIKAHPIKTALAAIGIPGLALADYGGQGASSPAAATPTQAKAAAAPKAAPKSEAPAAPAETMSPLDALIGAVAKSQGGKVSLNQLAAIGDFTARTSQDLRHPPTYKDNAAGALQQISQDSYNDLIAQSQAAKAHGDIETAIALQEQARKQQRMDLLGILGQDPQSLLLAQRMQDAQAQGN